MEILYLSHCVPNPPDKGERIRAFHGLTQLATRHLVHLACFARTEADVDAARQLSDYCASIYIERLSFVPALARGAVRFALGQCLTTSFYSSPRLEKYARAMSTRIDATVSYSSAMVPFAPPNVPLVLDMVDVDSEKWLQYAEVRLPRSAYAAEGHRLRALERRFAERASCTILASQHEAEVFRAISPGTATCCVENGVDFDFFDPGRVQSLASLTGRRFLVFLGAMDYYPNRDAVCWFASHVYPELRKQDSDLEFLIVGRNPAPAVRSLARRPGITVTGAVPDVRPYLAAARAVVAPLRIARGIQNKVLEALAMGKNVLASSAVCRTFGSALPCGVTPCDSPEEHLAASASGAILETPALAIRKWARQRFSWAANMQRLLERVDAAAHA